MYFRKKTSGGRAYLQIAQSQRVGGQVRQQVIATLGRLDVLAASGQLERLVRSGARFATQAMVLSAAQDDATATVRRIGPALVFERLWTETGCRAVIEAVAKERKHGFALERAIFLSVLHRLMGGGSDLAADRWREDYRIAGAEALELHHLYRAMAWLGEELPAQEQDAARRSPRVAPRTWSRSGCSPTGAISSAGSISCSWTRPASTSKARAARPSAAAGTARTIARTSAR